MPLSIRADSTDYLTATFTADHNVTGRSVEIAVPVTNAAPTTWYPADVVGVASNPGNTRWTVTYRILIGPAGGATQLTPGNYDWTVKITDTPEVPIRKAGVLIVTAT